MTMYSSDRCRKISNSYYNLGLEKAKLRNLSGAIHCLRCALQLNKQHTDARNLLGLIYYEIGEVAEALVQWVISTSLSTQDNDAEYFLSEIRNQQGLLVAHEQHILKFNQALSYAHNGNEDLAQITLNRIVEERPSYVKAQLLLSLLYIQKEEYTKAMKSLTLILRTDRNNSLALHYLSIAKENSGRAEKERKKFTNSFSHYRLQDDDVILPATYKEYTGWQSVVNILVGLAIGAASIFFLYIPTVSAQLSSKHNTALVGINEELNQANVQVSTLSKSNTELQTEIDRLNAEVNMGADSVKQQLITYQKLAGMINFFHAKDMGAAAAQFATMNQDLVKDIPESGISVEQIYSELGAKLRTDGFEPLLKLGDTAFAAADYTTAIAYYDMALAIKPDYVEAMYKKALTFKTTGDTAAANALYTDLVNAYPTSEFAIKAKADRGF